MRKEGREGLKEEGTVKGGLVVVGVHTFLVAYDGVCCCIWRRSDGEKEILCV